MLYGFVTSSTLDPNGIIQVQSLTNYGVQLENFYVQKSVTTVTDLQAFYSLMPFVKNGDTVVVHKFSSLCKDIQHFIRLIQSFQVKGIHFVSLSESIDTRVDDGQVVFRLFEGLSQVTQDSVSEKISSGVSLAKVKGGGKPRVNSDMLEQALKMYFDDHPYSIQEIVRATGVSRATLYRYLNRK
ncbi:Site-specific DNA recombinase [Fictibacillus solisalsi]|uniref:Site-specific DNA recombinase n=1 Tax=Fictibacillus solisalsi TaxID=459525 RepID=A0A1G9WIW6_9BACL|nr:recombinase family protein [Fictibacillus solisalsi]SDM84478.1 Site-specific DNA recombinase [Fictibacillus solisalsi]